MPKGQPKDPHAFNHTLKHLIDQHLQGDSERAAKELGVSEATVRGWVKGTRIPRFQAQSDALRKLRSLAAKP